MQDRYTGDVGDYGKYGLLRALYSDADKAALRLGVVWYLVPGESHNDDGKHVAYLNDHRFRECDPDLHDSMRGLLSDSSGQVAAARRKVSVIESGSILPAGTVYYGTPLSYAKQMTPKDRLGARAQWFAEALSAVASADLVFLDPDHGIECKSVGRTRLKGPKYVFWDDITAFASRGQSVVVYHHLSRCEPHVEQVRRKLTEFEEKLPKGFHIDCLVFKKGTCRAFFVASVEKHRKAVESRLERFLATPWSQHFVSFEAHEIDSRMTPAALRIESRD